MIQQMNALVNAETTRDSRAWTLTRRAHRGHPAVESVDTYPTLDAARAALRNRAVTWQPTNPQGASRSCATTSRSSPS